jgi:Zn-dependent protease
MLLSRLGFQWSISLGRLKLSIDPLVPIIMGVIGWVFADRYYPIIYNAEWVTYLIFGGVTALLVFLSILGHELGHAFAARKRNQRVPQIHLFAFGGMAVLENRKLSSLDEFIISVSGPIASLTLAGGYAALGWTYPWADPFVALFNVLGLLNLFIALFNLIPIYPLDGGRMLRAFIARGSRAQLEASILTYRIGSVIIALLFVAAIVIYAQQSFMLSIGFGIAGFYLSYMALNGKYQLIQIPLLKDLYLEVDATQSPTKWLQKVFEDPKYHIDRMLIPILISREIGYKVLPGEEYLAWANEDPSQAPDQQRSLLNMLIDLESGRFIELQDMSSYQSQVDYEADFVPLFKNKRLLGICDAREMQYWLNRKLKSDQTPSFLQKANRK